VTAAINARLEVSESDVLQHVEKVTVSKDRLEVHLKQTKGKHRTLNIPWTHETGGKTRLVLAASDHKGHHVLMDSIIQAHLWLNRLSSGSSVEQLASESNVAPQDIRHGLQLAFLSPELTRKALIGETIVARKQMPKSLPLSWSNQHGLLRNRIRLYPRTMRDDEQAWS
jgi:hypothetical protein